MSLNDCFEPGPNLAPLLFDILLRFRLHNVAFIAETVKCRSPGHVKCRSRWQPLAFL